MSDGLVLHGKCVGVQSETSKKGTNYYRLQVLTAANGAPAGLYRVTYFGTNPPQDGAQVVLGVNVKAFGLRSGGIGVEYVHFEPKVGAAQIPSGRNGGTVPPKA